ncbi:mitochondrial ribosomal protein L37-domain-containing protein [Nemania serpens]|nr:mitochondrial ribosomal protein L37-domain-containing protein [Nemania serpens]
MICRRCLQRASALRTGTSTGTSRAPGASSSISRSLTIHHRPISSTATRRYATPAATPTSTTTAAADATTDPPLSTPLADGQDAGAEDRLSTCIEGTVLSGLNYFKNHQDPVALADSAYPEWLWRCLDVQKKADEGETDEAGDEFSKSKKQRRAAAKRQRSLEAKLLAEGNLEALAPKIPLHHQTINLPANDAGTTEGAVAAVDAREELRRSMRRERKAKIKESNYLKSM